MTAQATMAADQVLESRKCITESLSPNRCLRNGAMLAAPHLDAGG
jgi:hypothetical protein